MHLNYYFLKQLSARLNEKLTGFKIAACFSQEKDELVLGFSNGKEDVYLKAILTSSFSALAFPPDFHRKRQNSVDLFPELLDLEVLSITQHRFERSFYLSLSEDFTLLFKMFGNRSNLIVYKGREAVNRFHQKFPDDYALNPWAMDRDFTIEPEDFPLTFKGLQKKLPTLGDLSLTYLEEQKFDVKPATEQQILVAALLQKLEKPVFYIVDFREKIRLSLLPVGKEITRFHDPLEAAQYFSVKFLADRYFRTTFATIRQTLERQLYAANQSLSQVEAKQKSLQTDASYSQTADIIMANLTNIAPRADEALLYDFYQDSNRLIKLKSTETPQKTAERLYKKAKNQQIELKILEEKALRKTEEIIDLEEKLAALQGITEAKELKQFLKQQDVLPSAKTSQTESPFREFRTENFKILVGKSSKNNDELTQKHAHKEDLWLHAKDVSGSHVIVKYQAGKPFPVTVIEKAAQLAAFYSKRKTDSLCPVIYTPKKFVRKPKGSAPGSVVVEREKVMLVKPGNPFERDFG